MDRLRGNESDEGTTTNLPSRALLWLIASFALLLSPQWDRLPLWLITACAVLAAWRAVWECLRAVRKLCV